MLTHRPSMVYTHLSSNQFEKTLKMAQDAVEAYKEAVDELTHLVCMDYPEYEEADFMQIPTLQKKLSYKPFAIHETSLLSQLSLVKTQSDSMRDQIMGF